MSLIRLAAANLFRNPLRSALTALGAAVAIVAFLLLRTVLWAWNVAADEAVPDRVVTRHKVTFIMPLPGRYVDDVRATEGVRAATAASWWGGREPNHENEFFATLAVDADTFLSVYDEIVIDPVALEAWKQDRQGAIVGDVLAAKFGWEIGETVKLDSTIFPGDYAFRVSGLYETKRKTFDRSTFLFHWDYFNETVPEEGRENVGWIVSRTDGGANAVAQRIDAKFDERDIQTTSVDEGTFNRSFLAGFSAVMFAIQVVSFVILGIMMMILGNTIAMGVRERTSEYGVLRAIGFLPRHLAILVLGEAVTLGLLGGLLGLLIGYPVVELGIGRFMEENMGGMFPYFRISAGNALLAFALSMGGAAAAAALPAFQASRLKVVDALRRVA
ncbi:MAG: ABC transporter permease [Deltaproteobacteria bacterium]|nr:ABC transporter permease [Deltaproteobacteria bacterium]